MLRATPPLLLIALTFAIAVPAQADEVYEVSLGPCNVTLCGADSTAVLRHGEVEVDRDGDVEVELEHASHDGTILANTILTVCFQEIGGGAPVLVGSTETDAMGNVEDDEEVGRLDAQSVMGTFFLADGDCDLGERLFVTMFSTSMFDDFDDDDFVGEEHPEDDNDRDGIPNDDDPDDDNDGIPDVDDEDDDNDGIPDGDDADPDDANPFDDVDDDQALKDAFRTERRELKDDAKFDLKQRKEQFKREKDALKEDFQDRKDDF